MLRFRSKEVCSVLRRSPVSWVLRFGRAPHWTRAPVQPEVSRSIGPETGRCQRTTRVNLERALNRRALRRTTRVAAAAVRLAIGGGSRQGGCKCFRTRDLLRTSSTSRRTCLSGSIPIRGCRRSIRSLEADSSSAQQATDKSVMDSGQTATFARSSTISS